MTAQFIEKPSHMDVVIEALASAKTLFIDTEFESRASGTTLCLLQVTDGEHTFLIDAITILDLTSLAPVMARPEQTWVVHAGRQDVELLMNAFDVQSARESLTHKSAGA